MRQPLAVDRSAATAAIPARGINRRDCECTTSGEVGWESATCVGQQLHVLCGAPAQCAYRSLCSGPCVARRRRRSPQQRPAFPSFYDWLSGVLAADQCISPAAPNVLSWDLCSFYPASTSIGHLHKSKCDEATLASSIHLFSCTRDKQYGGGNGRTSVRTGGGAFLARTTTPPAIP